MRAAITSLSLSLALVSASVLYPPLSQQVLQSGHNDVHVTEATIIQLLAAHNDDPVEVMRLVDPSYAPTLDEPRLLQVFGADPVWMTEGDKLRLRKQGLGFMDLTGHQDVFRSSLNEKQTGMSFKMPWSPRLRKLNDRTRRCRVARASVPEKGPRGHPESKHDRDGGQSRRSDVLFQSLLPLRVWGAEFSVDLRQTARGRCSGLGVSPFFVSIPHLHIY